MLVYFALDSIEKWISEFFTHSDAEARHTFADEIGHRLHRMNEPQQQEHWNRWLKRYWQTRLEGVPKPLEPDEIKRMMDWLPHLKGVFSEAVELVIQMPQSESGGKREGLVIFKLESSRDEYDVNLSTGSSSRRCRQNSRRSSKNSTPN